MTTQTISARICPDCGRNNRADAWNCEACGRTLSVGTITEVNKEAVDPADLLRLEVKKKLSDNPIHLSHQSIRTCAPGAADRELIPIRRPVPCSDRAEAAEKYRKRMLSGFLWAAGGLLLTSLSYQAASPGGTYFIFYGAILFGCFDFIVGFFGWISQ